MRCKSHTLNQEIAAIKRADVTVMVLSSGIFTTESKGRENYELRVPRRNPDGL